MVHFLLFMVRGLSGYVELTKILGSSMENWHAIMRQGLRNLSNTKLMTTGAGRNF